MVYWIVSLCSVKSTQILYVSLHRKLTFWYKKTGLAISLKPTGCRFFLKTIWYCKYHECTTGYFISCEAKKGFLTLNCCNWLRCVVTHVTQWRWHCSGRGNNYNLLYYVILNLSFASLHKKNTKHFVSFLHGSPFLLSVPFEDIFQDDVAIDLHSFLKVRSMSTSDIFSWLVNVVII